MRVTGSIIAAVLLAAVATAWVLSGQLDKAPAKVSARPAAADAAPAGPAIPAVRVRRSQAEPYIGRVLITGQTEASRRLYLRAMISGRIAELPFEKGARIAAGDVIARIDKEDRPARLAEAEARVQQRQIEYDAARQLARKGFQAETRRSAAFAALQTAKSLLARIRIELAHTTVTAPFDAVLNARSVEAGDVVKARDTVLAELIDLDPILVTAQVSEGDYPKLRPGGRARGRLANGTALTGEIRFIAAAADPETRTFRVELAIANPGGRIPEGATAQLELALPETRGHRVSAALFTLDEAGRLGLRVVGPDQIARFVPVTIVGGTQHQAVVAGLPDQVDLITVGHELVRDGQKVRAVPEGKAGGGGSS